MSRDNSDTLRYNEVTVYEEQLETKFSRETDNVFTLSLYYDVDGIGTTPPPFL